MSPPITSTPSDLAFVLYTNGSTVHPKDFLFGYGNFVGQICSCTQDICT